MFPISWWNFLVVAVLLQLTFVWFCESSNKHVLRRYNDKLYVFISNGSTWMANRKDCQNYAGDLVSIETEEEWQFIKDEIQNLTNPFSNEWHIGLHGTGPRFSSTWTWLSGYPLTINHWQPYQPSGDGYCANIAKDYLNSPGGLNDLACLGRYSPRAYICEFHLRRKSIDDNGPIFYERWNNINGSKIEDLTSNKNYPSNPTTAGYQNIFSLKEITFTSRNRCGFRLRSYFLAPQTGNYTFYTCCDDSCQLFLSRNVNPKDKIMIVDQPSAESNKKKLNHNSPLQYLEEGKLYYIELLFKEKGGVDFAYISMKKPNGLFEIPFSGEHFRRTVRGIDLPGKDCKTERDARFPDYSHCKRFTQADKLHGVKTALQELQRKLQNTSEPSESDLQYSMKTAGRKITFLLDDTASSVEETGNEGFEVTKEVEELGEMVAEVSNATQTIALEYPNVLLQIKALGKHFTFPDKSRHMSFTTSDEIRIEKTATDTGKYIVFSALYKNLQNILQQNISTVEGDSDGKYYLNSRIITSSIVPRPPSMKKGGVHIRLDHTRFKRTKETSMACFFWNFTTSADNSTGVWSKRGCRVSETTSSENSTVCECDHLTHFAVLMKVTEDEKPLAPDHVKALESITYVGCSLSLIGEVLAILTITILRLTRSETSVIHLHLVVALALSQLFFLSGIRATWNKGVCAFVAVALHYFNLVAFCWMLVEGVWLYVMVVRVFDTGYNRIKRYIIAAWTLPAVIVIITMASSFDGYGTKYSCWLSVEKGTIWSFVIPVLIVVLANAIILGLVVREILQLHAPTPADDNKLNTVRSGVKSAMVLLPILGVTWVFGVLAVNSDTLAFQYLFAIFNSLQGFFIFIFHCLLNSEVRKAFYRKKQIWSESHMFQTNSMSPPQKYDSDAFKDTQSTSMEKRPQSSTSTSRIVLK